MQSKIWDVHSKAAYEILPELSVGSDLHPVWLCLPSQTIFVTTSAIYLLYLWFFDAAKSIHFCKIMYILVDKLYLLVENLYFYMDKNLSWKIVCEEKIQIWGMHQDCQDSSFERCCQNSSLVREQTWYLSIFLHQHIIKIWKIYPKKTRKLRHLNLKPFFFWHFHSFNWNYILIFI